MTAKDSAIAAILSAFELHAWNAVVDNLSENESELSDYVQRYEDATERHIPMALTMERGGELKDAPFCAWLREDILVRAREIAAGIAEKLDDSGRLTIWRQIETDPEFRPIGGIGIHWTYVRENAISHFADGKPGSVMRVFSASIDVSDIDLPATVKANMSEEFEVYETEIQILENDNLRLVEVDTHENKQEIAGP
jgi:hypothetical protein